MPSRITITDANVVSAELRFTASGKAVMNIRIAVNKNIRKPDGTYEKGEATFLTCTAWDQRAERIAEENLQPGEAIFASGLFELEEYEKDGIKRITGKVSLDAFGREYKWLDKKDKPSPKRLDDDSEVPFLS